MPGWDGGAVVELDVDVDVDVVDRDWAIAAARGAHASSSPFACCGGGGVAVLFIVVAAVICVPRYYWAGRTYIHRAELCVGACMRKRRANMNHSSMNLCRLVRSTHVYIRPHPHLLLKHLYSWQVDAKHGDILPDLIVVPYYKSCRDWTAAQEKVSERLGVLCIATSTSNEDPSPFSYLIMLDTNVETCSHLTTELIKAVRRMRGSLQRLLVMLTRFR